MTPARHPEPGHFRAHDEAREQWRRAAVASLAERGVRVAPEPLPADTAIVRSLDALLVQSVRAARHASGAIRAYASLIGDAYGDGSDAGHWVGKITRSAGDLDGFVARLGTLRVCDAERPGQVEWRDVLARIASRCATPGTCPIEVVDGSRGPFRQRAELLGRALFHVVRNAVEATPRGTSVRVRIDESRVEGTRSFHVRVSDGGAGIARARADEIWRPFVTDKPGHAGLGLAYVATCGPVLGAVMGTQDGPGPTVHLLFAEEGELEW